MLLFFSNKNETPHNRDPEIKTNEIETSQRTKRQRERERDGEMFERS